MMISKLQSGSTKELSVFKHIVHILIKRFLARVQSKTKEMIKSGEKGLIQKNNVILTYLIEHYRQMNY